MKIDRLENESKAIGNKIDEFYDNVYQFGAGNNRTIFGDFIEDIAMQVIKKYIRPGVSIAKGLIKKGNKMSPQVDIIIYSGTPLRKCKYMKIAIVESKDVLGIVEVKAYTDKSQINNIGKQINGIKPFCRNAKKLVFSGWTVCGMNEEILGKELSKYCDGFFIPYKYYTNRRIYNYGKGLDNFKKILGNLKK